MSPFAWQRRYWAQDRGRATVRRAEPDGGQRIYQSSVTQEAVGAFMARAHRDLAGTGDEHVAMDVTDAGATWFKRHRGQAQSPLAR